MELWQKLQIKPDMTVAVLNAPADGPEISGPFTLAANPSTAAATITFVRTAEDLTAQRAAGVVAAREDRLSWFAYPKAGKLGTDLNRDTLNATLLQEGVRGIRQVALDDVWSALRFRPAE